MAEPNEDTRRTLKFARAKRGESGAYVRNKRSGKNKFIYGRNVTGLGATTTSGRTKRAAYANFRKTIGFSGG